MTDYSSDYLLIQQFLKGDESAFNRLALKYQEKIYWHARRMTGNHLDADEIVQEVLLVMYKKLNTFKYESSVYTWIFRITSSRSLNLIKRRGLRKIFSFEDRDNSDLESGYDIIADMEAKEKFNKLEKVLQKLPAKQREVFVLRNYDQLSYEEISEITGKSTGGLKANYFHAIKKVTEWMNENE
ncbi:MAG: RNA polymerase sigma factor [Ignavibacteriaceae bacterium]|nr:RNA polymerase sigma factor [Ignavibacteriaceae bacterium]